MRLTRRGWVVVAAVLVAVSSAGLFGERALNAVAAPGIVVLIAAAIQVRRSEQPTVTRELPPVAQRGDALAVRLRFDAPDSFPARVLDHLEPGLLGHGNDVGTMIADRILRYEIDCQERGGKRVGPTRIEARDVLGLVAEGVLHDNAETITVRPRVSPLASGRRDQLLAARGGDQRDRQVFEHLREYASGDALRDVHWKTSAKQPDDELIVKEFTADDDHRGIVVAASAREGAADAMADAAASVVVDLLDDGLAVQLVTPEEVLGPARGSGHRDAVLDHLARVDAGHPEPDHRDRADVVIRADDRGASINAGDRELRFADLALEAADGRSGASAGATATSAS